MAVDPVWRRAQQGKPGGVATRDRKRAEARETDRRFEAVTSTVHRLVDDLAEAARRALPATG